MRNQKQKRYSLKVERLGVLRANWGDRTAQYFTHETFTDATWAEVCKIKEEYRYKNRKVLCAGVFAPFFRVQVWEVRR